MFRRLQSGLPQDPVFAPNLEGLGYFVNEKDEIRNIKDPKSYFKYFLTRNDRHNNRQREAMNEACEAITHNRLEELGLKKVLLPFGAEKNDRHVPIFISSDIKTKKRVIVLFYEENQDLGIFAHRIIGGRGGINEGSAVNFVKAIQAQASFPDDSSSPGIILANLGQLRWWRRGKKAITQVSWSSLPAKSAVEYDYRFDEEKNTIPGNRNTKEHVEYVFNRVIESLVRPDTKLNIIGVSEGAAQVTNFLDNDKNLRKWGGRVTAFASLATNQVYMITYPLFRTWYHDHIRVYLASEEPSGCVIADHDGNGLIPAYGCPVFSLGGENFHSECLLPRGHPVILKWFQEVSEDPDYINPAFKVIQMNTYKPTLDEPQVWTEEEVAALANDAEKNVGGVGKNYSYKVEGQPDVVVTRWKDEKLKENVKPEDDY